MAHNSHTPEQMARINAFLAKANKQGNMPESYFAHLKYEIELIAWDGFANLQALGMSFNPIAQLSYLLSHKTPDIKHSKEMRKCASRALLEAASLGDIKHGEGLITEMKADVNYMTSEGETSLHRAIRRKRLGMAEMLMSHGARNIAGSGSLAPLCFASAIGIHQAVPLFVKYGVDVNTPHVIKDWNRFHLGYKSLFVYPLAMAFLNKHPKTCDTLLDFGAEVDLKIRSDLTIRELIENESDNMPQDMQKVMKRALSKPQKIAGQSLEIPVKYPEKVRV